MSYFVLRVLNVVFCVLTILLFVNMSTQHGAQLQKDMLPLVISAGVTFLLFITQSALVLANAGSWAVREVMFILIPCQLLIQQTMFVNLQNKTLAKVRHQDVFLTVNALAIPSVIGSPLLHWASFAVILVCVFATLALAVVSGLSHDKGDATLELAAFRGMYAVLTAGFLCYGILMAIVAKSWVSLAQVFSQGVEARGVKSDHEAKALSYLTVQKLSCIVLVSVSLSMAVVMALEGFVDGVFTNVVGAHFLSIFVLVGFPMSAFGIMAFSGIRYRRTRKSFFIESQQGTEGSHARERSASATVPLQSDGSAASGGVDVALASWKRTSTDH